MPPIRLLSLLCACILAGASASAARAQFSPDFREFRPSQHGFAFVNSFRGSPLPFDVAGLDARLGAPTEFGLCGGMSFAAADLYIARALPTRLDTPPEQGTPLNSYLYARQTASLGQNMHLARRFTTWMRLPTAGLFGTARLSTPELVAAQRELELGRPVHLGLVYVSGRPPAARAAAERREPRGQPWHNHQVLGYNLEPTPEGANIRLYDPNYPGNDDVVLRMHPTIVAYLPSPHPGAMPAPVWGLRMDRVVTRHNRPDAVKLVRGVMLMPYEPADPPRAATGG
jgi:hypothetical protein